MNPTYTTLAERMGDWMKKHLVTLPVHAAYPPYRIETATALATHLEGLREFTIISRSDLAVLRAAAGKVPFSRISHDPDIRAEFVDVFLRTKPVEEQS